MKERNIGKTLYGCKVCYDIIKKQYNRGGEVPMAALLVSIFFLYLLYLLWEAHTARVARKKLAHVVHVNGTRGKSTVSRLIEAGSVRGDFASSARRQEQTP